MSKKKAPPKMKKVEKKPSDEFLTPQHVAEAQHLFFGGHIDYDPFGHPSQLVQVRAMRTWETRLQPIPSTAKRIATNVPFSKAGVSVAEIAGHVATVGATATILTPASVSTTYFAEHVWRNPFCKAIAFLKRVAFVKVHPCGKLEPMKSGIRLDLVMLLLSHEPKHVTFPAFCEAFGPISNHIEER